VTEKRSENIVMTEASRSEGHHKGRSEETSSRVAREKVKKSGESVGDFKLLTQTGGQREGIRFNPSTKEVHRVERLRVSESSERRWGKQGLRRLSSPRGTGKKWGGLRKGGKSKVKRRLRRGNPREKSKISGV